MHKTTFSAAKDSSTSFLELTEERTVKEYAEEAVHKSIYRVYENAIKYTVRPTSLPVSVIPAARIAVGHLSCGEPAPQVDACADSPGRGAAADCKTLRLQVMKTQLGLRVGCAREKVVTSLVAAATMGSAGSLATLATTVAGGTALVSVASLAGLNFVLGIIFTGIAVATFYHTHPARPVSLRLHSFYLTGIVSSRREARSLVRWLVARAIVSKGLARHVLCTPSPSDLWRLGLRDCFPQLSALQGRKIASTLRIVKEYGNTLARDNDARW
jgi:hypothetical protein